MCFAEAVTWPNNLNFSTPCHPWRNVKAVDSIHIAKLRREQEDLQNIEPMKAVDSIAVTKARREQARDGFVGNLAETTKTFFGHTMIC